MPITPKPANWNDMQLVTRIEWLEAQRLSLASQVDAMEKKIAASDQTLLVIKGLLRIT